MNKGKNVRTKVQGLNLMDAPKTWFSWNGSEHNVKDAPAEVFDQWIRQYVDEIANVDTAIWEIFHRWGIINACISGQFLTLVQRPDGSQLLEEKSSESEAETEEKSSELEPAAGE